MRGYLIGVLFATISLVGANAQTIHEFRLLDVDGSPVRWSPSVGASTIVAYAFVDRPLHFPNARNCEAMLPMDGLLENTGISQTALRNEARAAFDLWEKVANITFRETDDLSAAGIQIGVQQYPEGRAFADVHYRSGPAIGHFREIERSLICLNPTKPWKIGFDGNLGAYDLRYTVAHEIGHAIGLDHPEPGKQLMSHRYHERFRTLQAGDVSGVVQIYGLRER